MPAAEANGLSDAKDDQLREDRRLLGRLLGEVIREQVGEAMFARIESIRQTAVNFRRSEDDPDVDTARVQVELESQLDALDIEQTLHVVRAFSYFSHLLNIAEDAQQHRRRRAYAAAHAPPRPGSFTHALERVAQAGVSPDALRSWFARAGLRPDRGRMAAYAHLATRNYRSRRVPRRQSDPRALDPQPFPLP
jgi:phosphoenolpyruvate carboxylase